MLDETAMPIPRDPTPNYDDPALIEAVLEGEDIHRAVAAQIYNVPLSEVTSEQRSGAKMVNFGIVYGVTSWAWHARR